jgi:hypothetical protein
MRFSRLFLVLIIALSSAFSSAQSFVPSDWIGDYEGKMSLSSAGGNQTVQIAFNFQEIKADSIWTYTMKYIRPGQDVLVKDYRIVKQPNGSFVLDEQDGILIDLPYRNGAFLSIFEVDGMVHCSSMSKMERGIRLELFGAEIGRPSKTSQSVDEKNQAFVVNSFAPSYAQTVVLAKKKP